MSPGKLAGLAANPRFFAQAGLTPDPKVLWKDAPWACGQAQAGDRIKKEVMLREKQALLFYFKL